MGPIAIGLWQPIHVSIHLRQKQDHLLSIYIYVKQPWSFELEQVNVNVS